MTARSVVPWLTSLTIVSLSGTVAPFPALAFRPLSHANAAAWPSTRAIELTIGQKSVSDGAISILPIQRWSASPSTEVGSCDALTLLGLYTRTLIRDDTPTHPPLVALSASGTLASVAASTLVNRPRLSSCWSQLEFSV